MFAWATLPLTKPFKKISYILIEKKKELIPV